MVNDRRSTPAITQKSGVERVKVATASAQRVSAKAGSPKAAKVPAVAITVGRGRVKVKSTPSRPKPMSSVSPIDTLDSAHIIGGSPQSAVTPPFKPRRIQARKPGRAAGAAKKRPKIKI